MDEPNFTPDPSMVSHLDQEGARFRDDAEEFEYVYGFKHDCHCAEDYAAGRVGQAPDCFFGMATDAMETCKELKAENRMWEKISNEFSTLAEFFYSKIKKDE